MEVVYFPDIIICVAVMWSMVILLTDNCFIYKDTNTPCSIMMWTFMAALFSWSIYLHGCETWAAVIAVSYLTSSAYIDAVTGEIYTFFSMTAVGCLMCIIFINTYPEWNAVIYIIAIWIYLKVLEKAGAYGAGDTDYMLAVHLLYTYMYNEAACDLTIFTLIASLLLHYIYYKDMNYKVMKKIKYPLTPCILAVVIIIIFIKGRIFDGLI